MPTITLNRKVFEKVVGRKFPPEKLRERIGYLGMSLESISDDEIVVEVTADRPDMLSEQGFARAFSSFLGIKTGLHEYKFAKSNEKVIIDKSMKGVRPFTACAIVKNLKFDDAKIREIIQIQEKLHITYGRNRKKAAIGIYPFEKIKTPIRFIALKPEDIKFQPLEFPHVINARQILSQHPTGREYAHLLEGFEKFPIFVDADDHVLSMPPIINSHDTGKITESTKDVFIECSGFDFNALSTCLNIIVTALADMGGTICSMELHYPDKKLITPDLKPKEMSVDVKYVNKVLGLKLKDADVVKLLSKMGYGFKNKKVLIPAYRADIMHQADLVEDVGIAYGFDNMNPEIPNVATIAEEDAIEVFRSKVANFLVGFGLVETNSYNLTNKDDLGKRMLVDVDPVELANSLSSEFNVLRSWMIPSMLRILNSNKHNEYPQKIFEIGTVFVKDDKSETNVSEFLRLAVVSCHTKADYTDAKQVIDSFMKALDLKYEIVETEHKSFIPGRVGRVIVDGKKVAYIGELHPQVLANFDLDMPVAAFELNISELFEIVKK
ncbi:MAG: phenylalanine--tRNA ligase subunit beta [archaeon]